MIRLLKHAVLFGVAGGALGCAHIDTSVSFKAKAGAPALEPRGDGCEVGVYLDGEKPPRAATAVGHFQLAVQSSERARTGGKAAALAMLREKACAAGVHYLTNVRVVPSGHRGLVYTATGAVMTDSAQ